MKRFARWCQNAPAWWWLLLSRAMAVCCVVNVIGWMLAKAGGDERTAFFEFIMAIWAAVTAIVNEHNYDVASNRERAGGAGKLPMHDDTHE